MKKVIKNIVVGWTVPHKTEPREVYMLDIPELAPFQLFTHKEHNQYVITEYSTGLSLGISSKTLKGCKQAIKTNCENKGITMNIFKKHIAEAVKRRQNELVN